MFFKQKHSYIWIIVAALLLTGCWKFPVEELQNKEFKGTPFQKALAKYYLEFSKSEAEQYDWEDADYFARKGLLAADGNDMEPEEVKDWSIDAGAQKSLEEARQLLLKAVSIKARKEEPDTAAKAVFLFDCWLEQQEENWQTEHIASCRNEFFDVLDYLSVTTPSDNSAAAGIEIDPASFEEVKRQEEILFSATENKNDSDVDSEDSEIEVKSSHAIFFDLNSIEINEQGLEILEKVIEELGDIPEYLIKLNGYADRSGNAEYNMRISKERTEKVREALVQKGVVENSIEIKAFGEEQQKIATEDGEKEPGNRVVEIFIH